MLACLILGFLSAGFLRKKLALPSYNPFSYKNALIGHFIVWKFSTRRNSAQSSLLRNVFKNFEKVAYLSSSTEVWIFVSLIVHSSEVAFEILITFEIYPQERTLTILNGGVLRRIY